MHTKNPVQDITPKKLEVLKILAQLETRQCYSPTMAELAKKLGVSRTTVFEHVGVLREKGLLISLPGRARSLKLTQQANQLLESISEQHPSSFNEYTGLPLLGRVAAGVPIDAIENKETISLNSMFGNNDEMFMLEVAGDSMIEDGIDDGDYVVCRRSKQAQDGQIVVAIIDEDSATVKRFYKEPTRIRLEAANPAYEPIYTNNCRIEAVVQGLVRRL